MDTERPQLTPELVRRALERHDGNVTAAARELGVSRQTVHEWMRAHGIEVRKVVISTL